MEEPARKSRRPELDAAVMTYQGKEATRLTDREG